MELYHWVLTTSWSRFLLAAGACYLTVNSFFGLLYYIDENAILNANPKSYWDAFLFSFQTSATIGYGYLLPKDTYANVVVIFDTLTTILFLAVITGLAFAKLTKPRAHVIFSNKCVISNYDGIPTLVFRMANGRDTHISRC